MANPKIIVVGGGLAGLAAVISQGSVALLIIPGLWRALTGDRAAATVPAAEASAPEVTGP